jgi:hypothetical protein
MHEARDAVFYFLPVKRNKETTPFGDNASVSDAIVPPSPWLSARMTIITYLTATIR